MASSTRQSTDNTRISIDTPAASNPHSLSRAVHARRAEYTRPQKIKIKIGTWNVAACPGTERDLKGWFGERKGIERTLAGLEIKEGTRYDTKKESISDQEERRNKK
jgi:inositol polyphosphate 5-phosphatase INPP5B/F